MHIFPSGWKQWLRASAVMLSPVVLIAGALIFMTSMPDKSFRGPLPDLTPEQAALRDRLMAHVRKLAAEIGERNLVKYAALDLSAEYIAVEFRRMGFAPAFQTFDVDGRPVKNVEAELRGASRPDEVLVIGAHYDSVDGCPAANDNGTGVAGMLEIARAFAGRQPARTVRFVAFVNEEPPYFHTEAMGSLVYARRCRERNENIVAMLSLETIGYFSDVPGSQEYPPFLSMFYPDRGDFISFVGDLRSGSLVRRCVRSFRNHAKFPSEGARSPGWVPGIDWSDHWAFSKQGYPALMVTDTAPFRYPWYHTPEDTPDKIVADRFARAVDGLAMVAIDLAEEK
jgi:hypothetical protein